MDLNLVGVELNLVGTAVPLVGTAVPRCRLYFQVVHVLVYYYLKVQVLVPTRSVTIIAKF